MGIAGLGKKVMSKAMSTVFAQNQTMLKETCYLHTSHINRYIRDIQPTGRQLWY